MTQRNIDDSFWGDEFVQTLEKDAKLLFVYVWTNKHCNSAGLYEITNKTINFETDITIEDIPRLFKLLEPKVSWYPDTNMVWVKNFVRRQSHSSKFLIAVAKCLLTIHQNGLVKEFLEYNKHTGIYIPYTYPTDTISIPYPYPTDTLTGTGTDPDTGTDIYKKKDTTNISLEDNVFSVYESNIGILTPILADQLKEIEVNYPLDWFKKAVMIACEHNARRLSYVVAILKRWKVEGISTEKKPVKKSKFNDGWD